MEEEVEELRRRLADETQQRQAAEQQRQAAEQQRQAAEQQRQAAEQAAEQQRQHYEQRIAEETRGRLEEKRGRLAAETQLRERDVEASEGADTVRGLPLETLVGRLPKVALASPSKAKGDNRVSCQALSALLNDQPLALPPSLPPDVLASAFQLLYSTGDVDKVQLESTLYPLATKFLPAGVGAEQRSPQAKMNAEALFGPRDAFEVPAHISLPLACEPEIFARVTAEGQPAFAAELKRMPPETLNEAFTYALLALSHSAFRRPSSACPPGRRFHASPPLCHVLLASGPMGCLLGVEWVGKLLAYHVSQPFFLGSQQHAAAVAALPSTPLAMSDALALPDGGAWLAHPESGPPLVSWTCQASASGRFWKIIQCNAFDQHPQGGAARLRALHGAYTRYAAALAPESGDDPPPASIVPAALRYGVFELLVDMPFVGHRGATADFFQQPSAALDAVAAAVGWLGRRALLYIDLRSPNVRLSREGAPGDAWLVDYDDMLLLPEPLRTADELLVALWADEYGRHALECAPALKDALRRAWPA
jgi:hypothetical protein